MSKHTPGKWQIMNGEEYHQIFEMDGPIPKYMIVSFDDDCEPWTIAEIVGGLDDGEEDANARLFVAAPLMHEALEDARDLLDTLARMMAADDESIFDADIFGDSVKTIAKAQAALDAAAGGE